ncbi:hypothetical protein PLESTB_000906000 [Pleodorina starrii]|uniref:DUF6314 domain-containing protein n=1 Tax=Pleodorina starrii TaxID=330485 RepID=A0A9W6BMM9_9CHLO|nr:hypothetical protein PLESTB_000906000 [Pleodorina starrii]GLC68394.1 hypothetical protein PLESTF_000686300 [Pleodorina starrii]
MPLARTRQARGNTPSPAAARPEQPVAPSPPPPPPPGSPSALVFSGLAGRWRLHRRIDSALPSEPSGTVHGTAVFQPVARPPVKAPLHTAAAGASGFGAGLDTATAAAAGAASATAADYYYSEQGEFRTDAGGRFRVRRQYVYGYSPIEDRLDVFFAAAGGARDYHFHSLRFGALGDGEDVEGGEGTSGGEEGSGEGEGRGEEEASGRVQGAGGPAGADIENMGRRGQRGNGWKSGPGTSGGVESRWGTEAAVAAAAAVAGVQRPEQGRRWWCRAFGEHPCDQDMHYVSYTFGFRGTILEGFEVSYKVRGPQIDYVATAVYSRGEGGGNEEEESAAERRRRGEGGGAAVR